MKCGVYLNLYKDRCDLVIFHNDHSFPEMDPTLGISDFNLLVKINGSELELLFKDLVYIGEF
jgi:hypothetical protein